jgi:hypothetical protein
MGELLTVLSNHTMEGSEALNLTASSKLTHFQDHFCSSINGLLTLDPVDVYLHWQAARCWTSGESEPASLDGTLALGTVSS